MNPVLKALAVGSGGGVGGTIGAIMIMVFDHGSDQLMSTMADHWSYILLIAVAGWIGAASGYLIQENKRAGFKNP